jgi:hypothetical protein
MTHVRKALSTLGGVFLAALLIAALAPRATRGIAAALVQVVNTSANPVPTREVGFGNEPFQTALCTSDGDQSGFCGPLTSSFTVPTTTSDGAAVRRLVIESLGGQCNGTTLPVLSVFLVMSMSANNVNGVSNVGRQFIVQPAPGLPGAEAEIFSATTKLYADPNTVVGMEVEAPPFATGDRCEGSVSGYLVTQ